MTINTRYAEMKVNQDRIDHLKAILFSYAEGDAKKERLIGYFTDTSQTTLQEIIFELTAAIFNGITFGNWPWSN